MEKIRVLIVEDQAIIREGLAAILSFQTDMEVVGQAKDGVEAMALAKEKHPHVILLDLVMPRQDGLTTIPLLKEMMPEVHILVLTSFADNDKVYQAIKSGAEGYMLKDATHTQLLQGIRDVAQGQASLYPSIAIRVIREINDPLRHDLHQRPAHTARAGDAAPDRQRFEQPGDRQEALCPGAHGRQVRQQHPRQAAPGQPHPGRAVRAAQGHHAQRRGLSRHACSPADKPPSGA